MSKQIDARERHPSTRRWKRHAAPALLAALLVLGGCGSGDAPPPIATAPLEACSTAFAEASGTAKAGTEPVRLSQCQFDANRNVTIGGGGCGPDVIIDRSFTGAEALGKITIATDGKLALPRSFEQLEVHTAGISVAGRLSLGTAACPVGLENPASKVKVVFTGTRAAAANRDTGSDKGIEVLPGGVLRLFGNKGVAKSEGRAPDAAAAEGVSWTHLSRPAGPAQYQTSGAGIGVPVENGGESVLHLARDVTQGSGAWRAGDWIVVATSSFSPFESEFVQIDSLASDGMGGADVRLKQALRHYHFGGADPGVPSAANYGVGKELNFGVDERSEVGLISRNVVLTAQTPARGTGAAEADLHWGGEIRIHQGYTEVSIEGVELEKFGKERLGSYPIHFHQAGTPIKDKQLHLINSNSIHHSYNKCVTIHSTSDISINNNVCARVVGHLFYQEIGDEERISFTNNLGLGAMSHYFDIDPAMPKSEGADGFKNWWEGDNLARDNGYDGFKVSNTDNQGNPTRGGCYKAYTVGGDVGLLYGSRELVNPGDRCTEDEYYVEQATGFWIVNPATTMIGNSIGGCQGMGKGYWYVAPKVANNDRKDQPVGTFRNNRVHACYDGVFAETEVLTITEQLFPKNKNGANLIAHFEGLTATRIRNRGIWIRPAWNAITDGRFATSRDAATLVSSGGPDGNAPGVWGLLKDSVFVGVSNNNVDRWGPCPDTFMPENKGCVDYNPKSREINEKKYQSPFWNSAGYMVYDGPVRVLRNHFVNFLKDPTRLLTKADAEHLRNFTAYPKGYREYEGDAALGWFQANQSAYPTASVVRELSFDNVDLRHQIYTEHVTPSAFEDGDKNTALIDLDGSLTGFKVVGPDGKPAAGEYPISLNNLPFNYASNAVDECLSIGEQDRVSEGRPTSLISPANMASLEFEALYPEVQTDPGEYVYWQDMIFTKTSRDAKAFQSMRLRSRNGLGIWEPKVASGFGYVVESAPTTKDLAGTPERKKPDGMPNRVHVGLTDAVKPDMDKKPFYVRLGIRYVDRDGRKLRAADFKLERGVKSWGGGPVNLTSEGLADAWKQVFNKYDGTKDAYGGQHCMNADTQDKGRSNLGPNGCPAEGIMGKPLIGDCPAGSEPSGGSCIFKKKILSAVATLADLTKPDGTPTGNNYFYDSDAGMLFFYVQQDSKNAHGKMPFGSCPQDKACPDENELDTYFPCPPQGCSVYSIIVDPQKYTPAPNATPLTPAQIARYEQAPPQNQNRLAYVNADGTIGDIVKSEPVMSDKGFLHWTQNKGEFCPLTVPAKKPLRQASRAVSNLTVAARPVATTPWQRWFAAKPKEAQEAPKLAMTDLALPVCRAVQ